MEEEEGNGTKKNDENGDQGEIEEVITEGGDRSRSEFRPETESDQLGSTENGPKNPESNQNKTEEIQEMVNLREIAKDLKKIKKQNFITHCLLSALIFVTLTWQCGEVSVLLSMKNKIKNPVKTVGDLIRDKIGKGKENDKIEVSLPSIGLSKRANGDLQLFQLPGSK